MEACFARWKSSHEWRAANPFFSGWQRLLARDRRKHE
jgi:hypothetical protein